MYNNAFVYDSPICLDEHIMTVNRYFGLYMYDNECAYVSPIYLDEHVITVCVILWSCACACAC